MADDEPAAGISASAFGEGPERGARGARSGEGQTAADGASESITEVVEAGAQVTAGGGVVESELVESELVESGAGVVESETTTETETVTETVVETRTVVKAETVVETGTAMIETRLVGLSGDAVGGAVVIDADADVVGAAEAVETETEVETTTEITTETVVRTETTVVEAETEDVAVVAAGVDGTVGVVGAVGLVGFEAEASEISESVDVTETTSLAETVDVVDVSETTAVVEVAGAGEVAGVAGAAGIAGVVEVDEAAEGAEVAGVADVAEVSGAAVLLGAAATPPAFIPPASVPPSGPVVTAVAVGGFDDESRTGSDSLLSRVPRRFVIVGAGVVGLGLVGGIAAALSGGKKSSTTADTKTAAIAAASASASAKAASFPAPTITTVPANGASGVEPSKPVVVSIANGTIASVQISGSQTTTGTLSGDSSSWTSNGTLALDTHYQMTVQGVGKDGRNVSLTTTFTTLRPSATIGVQEMWPGSGVSVGVGQPIRVEFDNYVPAEYRAAVEKACAVTTTPAVAGAWSWVTDEIMDWRPQAYWQTGTQVSVALNLDGTRAGEHQYFEKNHSLDFTIRGTDLRLVIDAAHYKATCYENGAVVRTWPVDTGMPGAEFVTWSGTFAVLGQGNPVRMIGDYGPNDKYDELVYWATQITYSGTYVHAAPWDGEIGHVNSSHGCIHCRTADAEWFYGKAHVGDVVQVTGTDKTAALTNGFADWTADWSGWLAKSAYGSTLGGSPVTG